MFVRAVSTFSVVAFLCLFASVAGESSGAVPTSAPDGARIYREMCSKCHGRKGEGVKDKYDDALTGDWSVEKLARVIAKTMPDDDPGKCIGADADAVAHYIHQTFYSREARARTHPARVELARLTNRQYANTVADLLRHFTDHGAPITNREHGLRAVYYGAKNFKDDQKLFERIDPRVDFDYGSGNPDPKRSGTNDFSMLWRGSVRAEETGDYEFLVKTPNGVRLWVNDDETPLIDATVTSDGQSDHHATLRLIGGRDYPLRLEYFKTTEKSSAISLQWKPPRGVLEPIPARNLSPERVSPTFVITTPFPPDDSSVGYERGVAVSKAWDEAATQAAIETANYVAARLDKLSGSKAGESNRQAKVEGFCREFVETAFRAPLSEEQKKLFVSSRLKGVSKIEDGVKRVVLLALKAPRFLYVGLEDTRGLDYAVAERLSYALWDSIPDRDLLKKAALGELRDREKVSAQARRMLDDPRAWAKMRYFLHQWLQMDRVDDLSKDGTLYPGFTPEIIADLRTSLDIFLEDVAWSPPANYRELLLADYLYLNERLAKFYGLEAAAGEEFVKTPLDPRQRSGIVTHPYLLAAFSYQKSTSPIHRGVFLTRNIIGRALKPPPMAVAFKDADFSPHLTMREKVVELTRPQSCQTCHSVINPLGFSLEQYDAVGRFRTQENNRPIDAASDYTTDEGETIRFHGARDLAEFAAASEPAQNGFIEQLFHQIVKQPALAYGPETMSRLRQSFVASQFNIRELLAEIACVSAGRGADKPVATAQK
jgi:hypothetical protein